MKNARGRIVRTSWLLLSAILPALVLTARSGPRQPLVGYSTHESVRQLELEARLSRIPSPEKAREHHRFFTAEPHPAGSERNNELARHIASLWKEQGWDTVVTHRYDVLVSYPREILLEMVAPIRYRAGLREDPYEADPDTRNPGVRTGYLALSASGEVTAPIVYAHSGNPEDYELLRRKGIDIRGKIALVRYSNPYSYRGFKALTAEKEGAAALLVYSDPAEDGYARGKVYPEGPWGPESHIQRGAITYDFMVAGDPLTPGWASLPGARRIPPEEAVSLPRIMAVPLSWRDAKPLLENMDGPEAPREWRGALPIKYRLGGRAAQVHLKVDMDTSLQPNYVVEARIQGAELPEEWIILGNHRDAWEFGAVDPSSGTASMMELSRALGELKRQGVRPKRTLVLCSWDGEEVALTGSTEWGEHFAAELKEKAVAYLNVDSSASGPNFTASAVASLAPVVVDVARTLPDPSGKTLHEAWRRSRQRELRVAKIADADLVDTRIGSGSDHTVFLNHLGIPTVGLTFAGPYGVYHSMYDSFFWMNRFGDPGYRYHTLMAQVWSVLALRLANAEILPFDFVFYADTLRKFVDEIASARDVKRRLDLTNLRTRVAEFREAAAAWQRVSMAAAATGRIPGETSKHLNHNMRKIEQNWLNSEGIPNRPWFKHLLYAARYTYAHLELPGLTEAVEKQQWELAQAQANLLEGCTARNVALLRESVQELQRATGVTD